MGVIAIKKPERRITERQHILLDWVLLMAFGNVVKQVFYDSENVQEISDYWWGAFLALFFIPKLVYPKFYLKLSKFIKTKWEIIIRRLRNLFRHG